MPDAPLWTCPACDRQFANRNQAHACDRSAAVTRLVPRAGGVYGRSSRSPIGTEATT